MKVRTPIVVNITRESGKVHLTLYHPKYSDFIRLKFEEEAFDKVFIKECHEGTRVHISINENGEIEKVSPVVNSWIAPISNKKEKDNHYDYHHDFA